ncbi:sulfotransferase family protein [Altibacter lentus]|uniref:sulfotransferase family protein n=1 Tax=Altibacter lentus TaxID=1223410 RepID=UPI0005546D3F|nr:sulfotransferase [Altibacter lentus]
MSEEKLIFIISQPRAGSTFLQRLLSNNNHVNTTSEPWILLHCAAILKPELLNATFSNTLTEWAYDEYKKSFPNFDFQKIEKEYILSLYKPLAQDYQYIIDKTPRYWELIDEIPDVFPKAKIIVLKRNPETVLTSMMRTWQLNSVKELSRFHRDLLVAPKRLQHFLDAHSQNQNVLEVRYEDLKKNLATETEAIYNWLNIPYHKDVLDIERNTKIKGVFGDPYQNSKTSYAALASQKSAEQLSEKQMNFIHAYLDFLGGTFLGRYGYTNVKKTKRIRSLAFENFKTLQHEDHHWKHDAISPIKKKFLGLFNRL